MSCIKLFTMWMFTTILLNQSPSHFSLLFLFLFCGTLHTVILIKTVYMIMSHVSIQTGCLVSAWTMHCLPWVLQNVQNHMWWKQKPLIIRMINHSQAVLLSKEMSFLAIVYLWAFCCGCGGVGSTEKKQQRRRWTSATCGEMDTVKRVGKGVWGMRKRSTESERAEAGTARRREALCWRGIWGEKVQRKP